MIKNAILGVLMLFFLVSLYANWEFINLFESNEFRSKVPDWNSEDRALLEQAYEKLVETEQIPISMYPYEIVREQSGYTFKFQSLEYLQVGSGPLMYSDIFDGCVYYHFDLDMNLKEVTVCG